MRRVVVTGGVLAFEDGPVRADLVIHDERIAAITLDASEIEADERIDATGLIVTPGGIDVHTHFKEPADPLLEGFTSGSLGAIAGGVTTVVEMPQATPPSSRGEHIREKRRLGEAHSIVDFALWGAAINQPLEQIDEMLDEGIVGIKSFMAGSSPGFPAATDDTLLQVFRRLAGTGVPYGLHAENDDLLQAGIARMQALGRKDPLAHAESRPPIVEVEAVHRALFFAEQTGGHAYIVHCSTVGALELVQAARARGVHVSVETCPQYLTLSAEDLVRLGPFGRCAPPLRSASEVEGLWRFLVDRTIDVVSSDHCGYTVESKQAGWDDIWQAPLGLSGIQTLFPITFDEMVNRRKLPLEDFVRVSAANPARIFSLYPRKGCIRVGADADLAFYDPREQWTVQAGDLLHRNKWTPFEGRAIGCRVVRTMIRGRVVYCWDGEHRVSAEPGYGRFLPRGYGRSD
ncbi:L-hydantoinase [bacterium HR26]|nr:L-hydantoinase [bacterium HR26]